MDLQHLAGDVSEAATVRRVFGDAHTTNGTTVIPVAAVRGGGGAGESREGTRGFGGGFGLTASPAGVFVVKDDEVEWKPAVNATAVVLGGQLVAIVVMLAIRSIIKIQSKRR